MLQKFCSIEFSNPINFEYSYFLCAQFFCDRGHWVTDDKSSAAYEFELMSVLRWLSDLSMEASFDQKINVVYLDESRRTPVHRATLDGMHEQVEEKVRVASRLDDQDERTPLHDATKHGHRYLCPVYLKEI